MATSRPLFENRPSESECNGHRGRFQKGPATWTISICSEEIHVIYEHELAHAWEAATLTDEQRTAFMDLRGYAVWDDDSVPPSDRGVEGVASIVQQGLSGPPLPPTFCDEFLSRLAAFEFLTGFPDPRLADWIARDTLT